MIHFFSKICKWTLTFLIVESFSRYFPYISCSQSVCFAFIQDGGKNLEKAYYGDNTVVPVNNLQHVDWSVKSHVTLGFVKLNLLAQSSTGPESLNPLHQRGMLLKPQLKEL